MQTLHYFIHAICISTFVFIYLIIYFEKEKRNDKLHFHTNTYNLKVTKGYKQIQFVTGQKEKDRELFIKEDRASTVRLRK